ncbi:MAG: hypothetical protein QGG09_06520 [Pirellulaceae bacterium]|nr:hypothetical protein [Pirellulaceae bacterium]
MNSGIRRSGIVFVILVAACGLFASGSVADEGHGGHSSMSGPVPSWTAMQAVGETLAKVYDFKPFSPAQPNHLWMKASDNYATFLHFNKPFSKKGAKLIFVGDAVKGRFCSEDQPDGGKTGFVHFHRAVTSAGVMGHGGKPGTDGWWLRHVAVRHAPMKNPKTMKKMIVKPGLAMMFMPTKAPACSSSGKGPLLPLPE